MVMSDVDEPRRSKTDTIDRIIPNKRQYTETATTASGNTLLLLERQSHSLKLGDTKPTC
jgi:hypothetical protein